MFVIWRWSVLTIRSQTLHQQLNTILTTNNNTASQTCSEMWDSNNFHETSWNIFVLVDDWITRQSDDSELFNTRVTGCRVGTWIQQCHPQVPSLINLLIYFNLLILRPLNSPIKPRNCRTDLCAAKYGRLRYELEEAQQVELINWSLINQLIEGNKTVGRSTDGKWNRSQVCTT